MPPNVEHYPRHQARLDSAPDDVTEQCDSRSSARILSTLEFSLLVQHVAD